MTVSQAIVELLQELKRISRQHEELTDTEVTDSLHIALNYYFIWGGERVRLPRTFGMFSPEGDALVARAFAQFLDAVDRSGELSAIPRGQARLDLLQARETRSNGGNSYDEYIGHRDVPLPFEPPPDHLFEDGDYDQ